MPCDTKLHSNMFGGWLSAQINLSLN